MVAEGKRRYFNVFLLVFINNRICIPLLPPSPAPYVLSRDYIRLKFCQVLALNLTIFANFGSFPFVPPSLVGAYYLHPPDPRALFLHNDLLCNDTCSVTGGRKTCWGGGGGRNGKDP